MANELHRLWVVAHRGGRALRPENTPAAFWHAIELGVDMVEADVQWTSDRQLVILHDGGLERTTNGSGNIGDCLLQDIAGLDAGSHFSPTYCAERVPTLEDLLRIARDRVKVLLHLKSNQPYTSQIVDLIRMYRMEFDVVLGVGSAEVCRVIKQDAPLIQVLSFGNPSEVAYRVMDAGADIVRLWSDWVTPDSIDRVYRAAKQVWVMCGRPSVNEAGSATVEQLREYRKLGVAGVILDDPTLAIQVNAERFNG